MLEKAFKDGKCAHILANHHQRFYSHFDNYTQASLFFLYQTMLFTLICHSQLRECNFYANGNESHFKRYISRKQQRGRKEKRKIAHGECNSHSKMHHS